MNRPLFRVAGIPVTVDFWFLLTLLLFYQLAGGDRAGVAAAVGIGVFVLIHELGHALAARRFGAETEIRLSFLMGWASYATPTPLARWQRNVISLAGPGAQLVAAVGALAIAKAAVPLTSQSSVELAYDLYSAISWAGIILAILNLLPLWPLDGGHVVASLLPDSARPAFYRWTIGAAAVMATMGLGLGPGRAIEDWAQEQQVLGFAAGTGEAVLRLLGAAPAIGLASTIFIPIFCALSAWQSLNAGSGPWTVTQAPPSSGPRPDVLQAVSAAERQGWATGQPGSFPRGWGPSPWLSAELARRSGASTNEISAVLAGLGRDRPRWQLDRHDRPELGMLLAQVPPPVANTAAVARVRVEHGDTQAMIDCCLASHHGAHDAEGFYLAAEGLAHRHQPDAAMDWLRAAVERHPNARRIATSPYFRAYHGSREFQQLLGMAERAERPT